MRILNSSISGDSKKGSLTVVPQDIDDTWVLYNHIRVDDIVEATTTRKVIRKSDKSTFRKTIFVKLRVTRTEYDTKTGDIRVLGIIENQIDDVPPRSAHTLEIEMNRKITLFKSEWTNLEIQDFENATNMDNKAEIGAVIIGDGIANVCIVTSNMTIVKRKIEVAIPKKTAYENSIKKINKANEKFYTQVYNAIVQTLPLDNMKALLLASPAFYASNFKLYLFETAGLKGDKALLKFADRTVIAHSSSSYVNSLQEVLKDPEVAKHLSTAKYGYQLQILENFYTTMNYDERKAWYGPKHVAKAIEMGAVATLIISDSLFRSLDIEERRKYIGLVEEVKESGGEVEVFSSRHSAGQQLDEISGIAAILKFPVAELEELSDDEDEDSDEE